MHFLNRTQRLALLTILFWYSRRRRLRQLEERERELDEERQEDKREREREARRLARRQVRKARRRELRSTAEESNANTTTVTATTAAAADFSGERVRRRLLFTPSVTTATTESGKEAKELATVPASPTAEPVSAREDREM
ncbi:uncharacterized protein K452DRAFT_309383 [Aplosporella prunicola CBS 121167]|uniref:Uncharacterized protein n=1 Tax=Aplosporella prunicola CBS 121167 TaxID=1176127 RepID=A0A6A6BDF1_9PEZI|nr:uncharacterized protein K452DRAFT_309383 [Aplosporella prunicola CBS 121167]KAF2140927.1 hypothetical protein K452DRAFT_309383 [Aplosporella prunicola CBS 121167]